MSEKTEKTTTTRELWKKVYRKSDGQYLGMITHDSSGCFHFGKFADDMPLRVQNIITTTTTTITTRDDVWETIEKE